MLNISHFIQIYILKKKKSYTCEEGGAHLRIYVWHLLMNFEKPENSEFWKMKTFAGDIIILHMCTKNHDGDRIFCHFGRFFALLPPPTPNNPENQNFEKWKKHLEMSSFQTF